MRGAAFGEVRALWRTRPGRAVVASLAALALLTLAGLALLWPTGEPPVRDAQGTIVVSDAIEPAEVISVAQASCPVEGRPGCVRAEIRLEQGADAGRSSFLFLPGDEAAPRLSPGDRIRVTRNVEGFGDPATATPQSTLDGALDPSQAPFGFVDFRRSTPMWILAVAFLVLVLALGRRVGALSLLGLAIGLAVVVAFVVPAILRGEPPFWVGLVGAFAVMFATIVVVYGVGAKALASLLGTAAALVLTAALAVVFTEAAHLTGTASEDATLLNGAGGEVLSLQGLVLCGMVIGALGVLNDVTVSQASTVLALRRADPAQGVRALYRGGMEVGRDHLGATVNTLAFAYAGASLPLLLIFESQDITAGDALGRETVATEVVAALVGSLGLVAAVPLTTLLAALLAARLPREALPAGEHAHHH